MTMTTNNNKKSKLVGFMGAPGTGKTILACALKEYFMLKKISTDICTEYAREFCFKYGIPKHPYTSYRISAKQFEKEDVLLNGSLIGQNTAVKGGSTSINVGDNTEIEI